MGGAGLAALLLGVAGAVLLGLVEVTTVLELRVGGDVRETLSGADRHGLAPALLGLAALPLAWLATTPREGTALAGLLGLGVVGLAALGLWALGDLPDRGASGTYGAGLEPGTAETGLGFWLELAGALSLLGAAAVGLLTLTPWRTRP